MNLPSSQSRVWESIVELARRIDHSVATRQGIDSDEVLRLSQAVSAFQRRLQAGSILAPDLEPQDVHPGVTGSGGSEST